MSEDFDWRAECVDPNAIVEYNGSEMRLRDVPDAEIRAMMGVGHYPGDIRHRKVHLAPNGGIWEYKPDTCVAASILRGMPIGDGEIACYGCGLDGT